MDSNAKKELTDLAGQLETIQTKIEVLIFEAFNQQDKQLAAITDGMQLLIEVLTHMDTIGLEVDTQDLQNSNLMTKALPLLEELVKVLQRLKLGQENSLSHVHEIEEEIAIQRSFLERMYDILLLEN